MNKVAEYEVERIALYEGTQVKGQIKTLKLYTDGTNWKAQIGNGKPEYCTPYPHHEECGGFTIGKGRWIKA